MASSSIESGDPSSITISDKLFMLECVAHGLKSQDPNRKVGACVVDKENHILGLGYNHMPDGCPKDSLPWDKDKPDNLDNKYLYVCHAAVDALFNGKGQGNLKGSTIYASVFPCNECAKWIVHHGIRRVVYLLDNNAFDEMTRASKKMFDLAEIPFIQLDPSTSSIIWKCEN